MSDERVQWEDAKEFSAEGLTVQVLKLPLPRPKFSVVIGSSYEDRNGKRRRGARITVRIEKGQAQGVNAEVLSGLLADAQAWIQEQVDQAGPRRAKRFDNGPQRIKPTGPILGLKKLKQRDAAAWQARQAEEEAKATEAPVEEAPAEDQATG